MLNEKKKTLKPAGNTFTALLVTKLFVNSKIPTFLRRENFSASITVVLFKIVLFIYLHIYIIIVEGVPSDIYKSSYNTL
jgi:hypothetical protein